MKFENFIDVHEIRTFLRRGLRVFYTDCISGLISSKIEFLYYLGQEAASLANLKNYRKELTLRMCKPVSKDKSRQFNRIDTKECTLPFH